MTEVAGTDQQAKLAALRAAITVGIEQAERGDFVEFTAEDIISEGMARRAAVPSTIFPPCNTMTP